MDHFMTLDTLAAVEQAYGITVRAVLPMRTVVGLMTNKGRFVCKRYGTEDVEPNRLLALIAVKAQLSDAGICCPYLVTVHGEPCLLHHGYRYVLEPWVRGRHADLSHRAERLAAVRAVACLHVTKVAAASALQHPPTLLQKLSYRLQRAEDVVRQGHLVGLSEREWTYWRERAVRALHELPAHDIAVLTHQDRGRGVFCHRDLAPHNILIRSGEPAQLIDFDLAGIDSPLYDLHQLLDHCEYATPREPDWAMEMLTVYGMIAPLSEEHRRVLMALRSFPTLLLREIADARYSRSDRVRKRRAVRVRYVEGLETRRRVRPNMIY